MSIDKETLRLYAVTDRTWLGGRGLKADVEKALRGGTQKTVNCIRNFILGTVFCFLRASTANVYTSTRF